jgi:thymidine kinase
MNNLFRNGYLELIIGPMYSGKTSKLLDYYKKAKIMKLEVLLINHSFDNRYGENIISNHDLEKYECITCKSLNDLNINDLLKYKIIIINEGQFFNKNDMNIIIELVEKYNKNVFISGLDGDYNRNKFNNNLLNLLDLIPYSDKVIKLNSICGFCHKNNAPFTKRIIDDDNQIVIGTDIYKPVCRECYLLK